MADPIITSLEIHQYEYSLKDLGKDYNGFNLVYTPGNSQKMGGCVIRILTDQGITGEYATGNYADLSTIPMFWHYLKGKPALQRERIYDDVKRALRQMARIGLAQVDNALWDIAGKYYNAPVHELLGGYKTSLPCYASTYHGDENGGLDCPEAFAEFAVRCKEIGYPAFKIHGWGNAPVKKEIANVLAVREAVGADMDLMIDPACELTTFGDALKVGWACDEAKFFWYEDPFRDGGISQFAHRKLRQLIKTPLLLTEHVRSLEPHMDFVIAEATDFVRGDVAYDGITGVMKLAHAAESLGIDIEFHGANPTVRQCMASVRNSNYYEMGLVHPNAPISQAPELYLDYDDSLEAVDKNGHIPVPKGPGIGVEINWDWINANRTNLIVYE